MFLIYLGLALALVTLAYFMAAKWEKAGLTVLSVIPLMVSAGLFCLAFGFPVPGDWSIAIILFFLIGWGWLLISEQSGFAIVGGVAIIFAAILGVLWIVNPDLVYALRDGSVEGAQGFQAAASEASKAMKALFG